ncbi:MAG TPA: ATP-binding protein [Verrucomicrobiota bacterium]|nr:ATP-binding protein [Verrucomicrobiota bacterium]
MPRDDNQKRGEDRRGRALSAGLWDWMGRAAAGLAVALGLWTVGCGRVEGGSPWRLYRAADGLAESLTTALTVGPRGSVWAKHGELDTISVLDGYGVARVPAPPERLFRIYESRAGRVWAVSPQGLMEYVADQWMRHPLPSLQKGFADRPGRALRQMAILPAEQDRVLVLLPDRLIAYRSLTREVGELWRSGEGGVGMLNDVVPALDGGVWVSAMHGLVRWPGPLAKLNGNTVAVEHRVPHELGVQDLHRPIEDEGGGVTAVAEASDVGRRVMVHFDGSRWRRMSVSEESLLIAWRGEEGGLFWGLTRRGLVRLYPDRGVVMREAAVPANQYYDAAVLPRGVFWLASLGGLVRYSPLAWRAVAGIEEAPVVIHSMAADARGRLWLATSDGPWRWVEGRWEYGKWPEGFDPSFRAGDRWWPLGGDRLAIAPADQLWVVDGASGRWTRVEAPDDRSVHKILGQVSEGVLGVHTVGPEGGGRLELFDGDGLRSWPEAPPLLDLGQELFFLERSQNGDWWLGGSGGPAVWRSGSWVRFGASHGYTAEGALCWVELPDGRIWCAGLGRLCEFDGKTWVPLLSGLDRVSGMIRSHDGSVWVATGSGLYRHTRETWASVGEDEGLPSEVCLSVYEDSAQRLWVGTARGLARYHPRADVEPPRTVSIVVDGPVEGGPESMVQVRFRGRDRWQATADHRLLFSHRLDGGAWSPFRPTALAVFRGLRAGSHRLEVRALDRNWNIEPRPAMLDFEVIVPWHRDRRLLYVGLAAGVAVLFSAGVALNRHWRLRRSFAEVERKVADRTRELEQATQALAHSQKMTALGTLAAGIAHDFNNILSIIRGSAQVIEANLEDREKVRTRLSRIQAMVDQASGIVTAMLGFGHAGGASREPCDPAEVVEQTLRLLGDRLPREVALDRAVESDLPRVWAARDLLERMLLNLILNAADAVGSGGTIRVRARRLSAVPSEVVLAPTAARTYVAVSVEDSGCGIAPEIRLRLFEPFFTTKALSSRRGAGLGLFMVYESAKEMGHGLAVESEIGRGSRFTVILPEAEEGAAAETERENH